MAGQVQGALDPDQRSIGLERPGGARESARKAGQNLHTMNPEHLQRLLIVEMPYGKYKGRLIADLPGHYLGWFAREGFPKGELGTLLALMYELDHNALRHLLDPL